MVAGRPRRSAAPDSYRIAFPELTSSSSGEDESEDGDEEQDGSKVDGGDAAGNNDNATPEASQSASTPAPAGKKKNKKKRKSPSPDDEPDDSASGSEFEPEVVKNKDGTVVEVEEEEDDDDFEEDVVAESDSGDSAAGEKDLDNISIANSDGLESGSDAPTGKQGIKFGKTRYIFAAGTSGANGHASSSKPSLPAVRIVGRTLSATAPTFAGPRKSALRKKMHAHLVGGQKKLGLHELSYGPCFWPPPFILSKAFDDPVHTPKATSTASSQTNARGTEKLPLLSDAQRLFHLKRIAYLPFGPMADACIDIGWYKGKWTRSQDGSIERAQRWGGWYESLHMSSASFEFVQNIDRILPHLPRNIFPPLPSAIHLEAKSEDQGDKVEENEDDAWDQSMAVDGVNGNGTPAGEGSNAADIFRSDAGHLQGHVQQAQRRKDGASGRSHLEDDGVVRFMYGPIAGPGGYQLPQVEVEVERFTGIRLDAYLPNKPGFAFNAGGPVWGLDWCPQADDNVPAECEYLAVSTVSEQSSLAYRISQPVTPCPSMIQLWSLDTSVAGDFGTSTQGKKGRGMRFDLALLIDFEAIQLQWCPRGGDCEPEPHSWSASSNGHGTSMERMGLLAALSTQGVLQIIDVPKPESARAASAASADDLVFIKRRKPLLQLNLGNVPISCFEWASHERIIAGCTTGHVAIFDIGSAIRDGQETVEPIAFFPMHDVDITAIAAIRQPHLDSAGQVNLTEESPRIATTSLDGSCKIVDLRDVANVFNFGHERAVHNALAYQPISDALQFVDQEMGHRYLVLKGREFGTTTRLTSQSGPVFNLACSDFHPFFASASADGSASIGNTVRRFKRGGHSHNYLNRLYRMDFNRKTGTFRMLDNIIPDARVGAEDRTRGGKAKKKKDGDGFPEVTSAISSYSWSPEIAVHRVAWSHSIRRAHILASGMACGLLRVDMTASHWTAEVSPTTRDWNFKSAAGDESD